MSAPHQQYALPPAVQRVLDALRARIRAYVLAQSVARLVVFIGLVFWIGLALDWLFEPTPGVRRIALVSSALAAAWIIYRSLLRRLWAPISDASAALLLERRFPALNDHVLTAVTIAATPQPTSAFHAELIDQTNQAAAHAIARIRVADVFDGRPLVRAISLAAALVLTIAVFAAASSGTFGFWLERIALSNRSWPRRVQLEVVGFAADAAGRRVEKVAQDDDFELHVRASNDEHEPPDSVEIRYTLADGRRGRDTMIRVGEAQPGRDPFQLFRYQFKRVAGDLQFDVVGGDDRIRHLMLQVVDRPELHAIELECIYPKYLTRQPRRLPVTGGMRIPEGTQVILHAASTKPLTAARIHRSNHQDDVDVPMPSNPSEELRWNYGTLVADDVLLINVTDVDGVGCREPYRVSLAVVPDELPQVAVRLDGIGAAVTPDATIPFAGKVTDDYGLQRVWFDYQVQGGPAGTRDLARQANGRTELTELGHFDLQAGDESTAARALVVEPGNKLTLTLHASDRYDLTDEPRAGTSQAFTLDIVTPSQLLALIERRELALRQRFEAIYEKLTDTRNLLNRVEFVPSAASDNGTSNDPIGEAPDPTATSPVEVARREIARRRLRVSGALQNIVQATEEVRGVADAFDDLHDQIVNNRIDNDDLKSRLREQIAQPLHQIADRRMPSLAAQVKLVEDQVDDPQAGQEQLAKALALADAVLVEMRQILDRMRELESYNEAVALLRDIITDQEEINRRTKQRQKERLQSLLDE